MIERHAPSGAAASGRTVAAGRIGPPRGASVHGGGSGKDEAAQGASDRVSTDGDLLRLGHILKHGADVLFIDHAPPAGIAGPLGYVFRGGFPTGFGSSMTAAVEKVRAEIAVCVRRGLTPDRPGFPKKLGEKMLAERRPSDDAAASFASYYACSSAALKRQGWRGEVPAPLPVHDWNALRDHELGYPGALSANAFARAAGGVAGRPLQYLRGTAITANRPFEQGQKGGRTLFTSLPFQASIALLVAMLSVDLTDKPVAAAA